MQKEVELIPHALLTEEEAYDALRQPSPEARFEVRRAVNRATLRLEGFCDRRLLSREHTWRLDGSGLSELYLPEYPVTSVTSLPEDLDLDLDDLLIDDFGLIRLASGVFPRGSRNVEVHAVAGYLAGHDEEHDAAITELKGYCADILGLFFHGWVTQQGEGGISVGGMAGAPAREVDLPARIQSALYGGHYVKRI